MEQLSFTTAASRDLYGPTRRELILEHIRDLANWDGAVSVLAPHWPSNEVGRRPTPLALLLRLEVVRALWSIRTTPALLEFVSEARRSEPSWLSTCCGISFPVGRL